VPTERAGEPFLGHVEDVLGSIAGAAATRDGPPPLVVVESTITPGATDDRLIPLCRSKGAIPEEKLLVALAPRRDWLVGPEEVADGIDRVYGGVGPRSADAARSVLSLLHDRLHRASSHAVVELVKCAENALRHLQISLGNQLSLAYPDVDVVEALSLAGTKWNIETVHPSFGTGGYCVPLSSKYLLAGARRRSELSLLTEALETERRMRELVAARLRTKRSVAILGLAYRGGVKVATLSPTLAIVQHLRARDIPHSVHDPLYTPAEISELCGGASSDGLPETLRRADAVLVVTDHAEFRSPKVQEALFAPREGRLLVLDSPGLLADWPWPPTVDYFRAGGANWLEQLSEDGDAGAR
jgi:nucleotide sugar dehydrogenase